MIHGDTIGAYTRMYDGILYITDHDVYATYNTVYLHEISHIFNYAYCGRASIPEEVVTGYMYILMTQVTGIQWDDEFGTYDRSTFAEHYIERGKKKESNRLAVAWAAYAKQTSVNDLYLALKQVNSCSSGKEAINKLIEISGKTAEECFGQYTEQLREWGLIEENSITKIATVTLLGNESNTKNKLDFSKNDTQAEVIVEVSTSVQPKTVTVKLGNNSKQNAEIEIIGENKYTYKISIDVSSEEVRKNIIDNPTLYVEVIDTNDKSVYEEIKLLIVQEQEGKIEIKSIQGNNTRKELNIDLEKDELLIISTKLNKKVDKVRITVGEKNYETTKYSIEGDSYIYSVAISLDLIKEKLKGNNKVLATAIQQDKEIARAEAYIEISSEKVTIGNIEFQQVNNEELGKYDVKGNEEANISVILKGIDKKEDISKVSVSLPGFTADTYSVEISKEEKTANMKIHIKKKAEIELKNEKTNGTLIFVINQELIKSTFEVEVINGEINNNIEIKYYDNITKKYVILEENQKELNIEAEDIYNFSVKISGIEEGKDVKERVGSTTIKLGYSNGIYSTGCNIKETGTYEVEIMVSDTIIRKLTLKITIKPSENKCLVLYANGDRDKLNIPNGWDEGTTDKYSNGPHGAGGENYFIFKDTKNSELSYFCFEHGKSLDPSDHYVLFDSKEYAGLLDEQKLILAFLGEVKEFTDSKGQKITFNSELRFGVQQFYIWGKIKGQSVNYGIFAQMITDLTTFPNKYINVNKKTIIIDGKVKELTEFSATEYIAREQHNYDGTIFELGDYVQPFFKFKYNLEEVDTPKIYLRKIDKTDTEKKLQATFEVFVKNDKGTYTPVQKNPVITSTEEDIKIEDISLAEKGEYLIVEKIASEGYNITKQYIMLEVNPDAKPPVKITVVEANMTNTDGSAKPESGGTVITDEGKKLWSIEEKEIITEKDGNSITYVIVVKNDKGTPQLKLKKLDKKGESIELLGKRGSFTITISGAISYTITKELDDNAEIIIPEKELEGIVTGSKINVTIKENTPPDGYKKWEKDSYEFTATYLEDKNWKIENNNNKNEFNVTLQGGMLVMELKNEKDLPEIEITKVDEEGNKIEDTIVFTVYEDKNCTKSVGTITITNGKAEKLQLDNIEKNTTKTYYIKETSTPMGYKELNYIIALEITVNQTGKISKVNPSIIKTEEGEIKYPPTISTEENTIKLNIKNEKVEIKEIELQILKVDADNGQPLPNVGFSISGDINGTGTTNSEGIVGPFTYKEPKAGSRLKIKIEENGTLENYIPLDGPITVEIDINPDGTINEPQIATSENQSIGIQTKIEADGTVKITVIVKNTKKELNSKFPLLMYLKGKVWLDNIQGKESEINGELDGGDKKLEGILVTLYEEDGKTLASIANVEALDTAIEKAGETEISIPDKITEHIQKLKEKTNSGETNITCTNENGEFEFYGLRPDKSYVVKFTYNGMRYSEVKVSTTMGISGFGEESEETSNAIEDSSKRRELIKSFSEIGTYPYNYYSNNKGGWNKVYTQTEVEEAMKAAKGNYLEFYGDELYSNISNYITDQNLVYFIKDSLMSATTAPKGNILGDAEDIEKSKNGTYSQDEEDTEYVYPIITTSGDTFSGPNAYEDAVSEGQRIVDESSEDNIIGYYVIEQKGIERYEIGADHFTELGPFYIKRKARVKIANYKGIDTTKDYFYLINNPGGPCHKGCVIKTEVWRDEEGTVHTRVVHDPATEHHNCKSGFVSETEYPSINTAQLVIFQIVEGYNTKVESNIVFAEFDTRNEPYLTQDSRYRGGLFDEALDENTPFGWFEEDRDIQTIYNELADNLDKLNQDKIEEFKDLNLHDEPLEIEKKYLEYRNLGLAYRPTMDLGLYDDVVEAYVNINNKEETYEYDKREANGGAFKFGVNDYDINSGSNDNNYASYYSGLSNGNPNEGSNEIKETDYTNYLRKEDIVLNTSNTKTETGKADAGNYPDYPVEITITYKIKIVNQSGVKAAVTEIVDYYNNDFKINGVYKDKEKTQRLEYNENSIYSNRGAKRSASGFNTVYIPLGTWLENNGSEYIYIELGMINPKSTLGGSVLDSGYNTLNYSEINGYRTEIGVLDIDSVPGDLVEDGRLENGKYDDDESKSPTLIFKNPSNASRTIKGTVFEDLTGKEEIKSYIGEERNGNGTLDESEPKLVGINVQLVEVDNNGYEIKNSSGTGLRAETLTDDQGNYEFTRIVAGSYMIKFEYGNNEKTVLIKDYNGGSNSKSYNGQDYENTLSLGNYGNEYWYTIKEPRNSDAVDLNNRRTEVMEYSQTLTNHIAETFNSWKDKEPNMELVNELIEKTKMQAETKPMTLEVESVENYKEVVKEAGDKQEKDFEYIIENIDFGIVERERSELQITKKVSYISIVDSAGKEITGGTYEDWETGNIQYVKWIQGTDGFVDMEIDKELLSGAILKITYEIKVQNTSEAGNNINQIQVVDYVSNNLNFDKAQNPEWTPVTVEQVKPYINNTSLDSTDISNKIDLSTYQTILMTTFNGAGTKTLTLEKNLSSEEDSNFNYENQVEIVSSYNPTGRGDYSSIYGNLDPTTYTSRQGNLNWDNIGSENQNGFRQMPTDTTVVESGVKVDNPNVIRLAEKDSGNAEEVIITPPTGTKGIVFETQHYILAIIGLLSLVGIIILIKKYNKIGKE